MNDKPSGHIAKLGLKSHLGILIGKLLAASTRLTGRGGTTLPGRTALKLSPAIMGHLAGQLAGGAVIVTGTNGKTTTASLITGMIRQAGYSFVHNRSGSNMSWGVASSLIDHSSWSGRLPGDYGVMEVDEGAFPEVVKAICPRGAVITNIFRDQLDRFGEIDHIQKTIKRGLENIPGSGFQVLNADDPSLTSMQNSWKGQKWFYGFELSLPEDKFQNTARDLKSCPLCSSRLDYDQVYFAHLGHYRCPSCSFRRPQPDVRLLERTTGPGNSSILKLDLKGRPLEVTFPLMGTYNLYNALAAITCGLALEIPLESLRQAVSDALPSFGRMERFVIDSKELLMVLIKNPVGANEVMRTLIEKDSALHLLIAINDKLADGTDVSWLWDADFEQLAAIRQRLSTVIVSGIRAWDMAVRLKYAGLEDSKISVEENMREAIMKGLQLTPPGETLFVMPTYTAMLEMRRIINAMGFGRPFWEAS
jgi:UDP-N-acetylmuramyl tripeptide synthase